MRQHGAKPKLAEKTCWLANLSIFGDFWWRGLATGGECTALQTLTALRRSTNPPSAESNKREKSGLIVGTKTHFGLIVGKFCPILTHFDPILSDYIVGAISSNSAGPVRTSGPTPYQT